MDVQRYSFQFLGAMTTFPDEHGPWVRFTDHEAALSHAYDLGWQAGYTQGKDDYRTVPTPDDAALAAARDEGYEAGLRARWGEREDRAWNAALDAVLARNAMAAPWVAALRKTPPQPEALTREQQNERWRQDYNTQARLRRPAAAQPEPRRGHCPQCDSPAPHLHPAVQHEGEVQPCSHPFHAAAARPEGGE